MSLSTYNKKRNFSNTPEPNATEHAAGKQLIFVVQRHHASHLHYDFRLELNGVLKSWAVPKGPSMNPKDKRLAMMVEDHPYDYHTFQGTIPQGNYGAGEVEIWDNGTYSSIEDLDYEEAVKKLNEGLDTGNLKFTLHGEKLKGEFALVKTKRMGENAWLLIKHRDEEATDDDYTSEDHLEKVKVISKGKASSPKKLVKDATEKLNKATVTKASTKKATVKEVVITEPDFSSAASKKNIKVAHAVKPMLAHEIDKPFSNDDWIFEIKWDGYRAIAELEGNDVQLYSRNATSYNEKYLPIVKELQKLNLHAVLDGEVVVLDEEGHADFNKLQLYLENQSPNLVYYVFDILSINGDGITGLPLLDRKEVLREILPQNDIIRYSDHVVADGEGFFKVIEDANMEGIMAKKATSKYLPGVRTNDWLKIKHQKSEDVFIAGYTEPQGQRQYFGALILAKKKGKQCTYVGHVGTGFNTASLQFLFEKMQPFITPDSCFEERITTNRPVTWVAPTLKCEVRFTEWTKEGFMRHPTFLGLKPDNEVLPMPTKKSASKQTAAKEIVEEKAPVLKFGKISVPLSNQDKLYWPEEGITKGEVIDYYQQVAEYILPYLKDRPQSLRRNPNGISEKGFFQKDAGDNTPDWVKTVSLPADSANRNVDYIICNDKATLAYLSNLGCIEFNAWNSTTKQVDNPDYLILDIDPSDKNTYDDVVDVALAAKEILDKAGCISFAKTSGATGMHVFVPMGCKYDYDAVKHFAEILAHLVTEKLPKTTSLERSLEKRGQKIYLDFMQNRKGQTISSVYSLRPKPGASVSTPLDWKEVKHSLDPKQFNIKTILNRLDKKGDLFKGVLGKGVDLEKALGKMM
jgi:bifunctional non-homologous end joining protein LigD